MRHRIVSAVAIMASSVVLLSLLLSPASAQLPARPSFLTVLTVVDANGELVGNVIGVAFGDPVVLADVEGFVVPLIARKDFLTGFVNFTVAFESTDCSGQAFAKDADGRGLFLVAITAPRVGGGIGSFFVEDPNGTPQTFIPRSKLTGGGCQQFALFEQVPRPGGPDYQAC